MTSRSARCIKQYRNLLLYKQTGNSLFFASQLQRNPGAIYTRILIIFLLYAQDRTFSSIILTCYARYPFDGSVRLWFLLKNARNENPAFDTKSTRNKKYRRFTVSLERNIHYMKTARSSVKGNTIQKCTLERN